MAAKKRCLECPALGHWRRGRCPEHERLRDKARGPRAHGSGSDTTHTKLRRTWQRRMNAGETVNCWRCGKPIDPNDWHLGHDDHDRTIYRGPECPPCNLSAAGRARHGLEPVD